jgi:carbamoyltransferase
LNKEQNSSYYDLIDQFSQITGIGAILNTSFNLHGFPIVMNVSDAFHVFENSGLDHLLIENILISKK